MQNDDAEMYKMWMEKSFERIKHYPSDEQLVFVNAWNEWAEGCHLEPDKRNGKKFLQATLDVVKKLRGNS